MKTCIISIGDELLQGYTIDTNSTWIAKILSSYGIEVHNKITIKDDINSIVLESQRILKDNYKYLFITGGLGPTRDDITKEAFCKIFNSELEFDKKYYNKLNEYFKQKSIVMPEINRSQAMMIRNADPIPNDIGSALGIHYFFNDTHIFIMPGVPREMKKMIRDYIIPDYFINSPIVNSITIKTAGIMESQLAEKVDSKIKEYITSFKFAFLPSYNGVSFRINKIESSFKLQDIADQFYKILQPHAYGFNDDTLQSVVGKILSKNGLSIALAESCTGGLIGKKLTEIPGSSNYFIGGIIAYSNELKVSMLNVDQKLLKNYGAVSSEIALSMAENIRKQTNADIGLSCTGISGPSGSTNSKDEGLVYIGIKAHNYNLVKKYKFNYGRKNHRELTSTTALNLLRLYLINNY